MMTYSWVRIFYIFLGENFLQSHDANDFDDSDGDGNDNGDDIEDDIYIMMKCLSVTKNHHFLLGVSCNHLNPS